ncbi:MAG: MFS transporter [Trebonia sp.]
MPDRTRFAESARSQPGLVCGFLIDALGTGMFLPFSLLFFLDTTSLSLARIGFGLSIAAVVRIPVTIAAGPLSDRFGPRSAIAASQLLQAVGFVGYLFVHGFWQLVAAAVLVQIGNSIYWVAYPPLIFAITGGGEREHWFALCTALRTAGVAVGGVIAGATVGFGGRDGFLAVAAVNAASFVLGAFFFSRVRRPGPDAPGRETSGRDSQHTDPDAGVERGWRPMLRNYAFLGFVVVNLGLTFLSLATQLALPVFLVKNLGLAKWAPGLALALNAVLMTVSAPVVLAAISGRRRHRVLTVSQALLIVSFGVFLLLRLLPAGAAIALVLIAILPFTTAEVMQAAVVPAVVTESATPQTLGRYMSAYQMTFSIGDIIVPTIVTVALHTGAAALWLPMAAIALLDLIVVGMLSQRMPALTQRVGAAAPEPLEESRGV